MNTKYFIKDSLISLNTNEYLITFVLILKGVCNLLYSYIIILLVFL